MSSVETIKYLSVSPASCLNILGGHRHDLAEHDRGVSVQEGNTRETLAVLEGVHNEGLEGFELALSHLVGLEGVGLLSGLSTSLLTLLPIDFDELTRSTTAADEADGGVPTLELTGDLEGLDLGSEVLDGLEGSVVFVDHDVTSVGHVVLVKTLDVHANVVTGLSLVHTLVVHLDGEDLSFAWHTRSVGGEEDDILVGLNKALLNTSRKHITDTLDLVDTGDGKTHRLVSLALWWLDEVVEGVQESVDADLGAISGGDLLTGPPSHLVGLLNEVVTHPAGNGHDRN
jgi:hypothetical protein